MWFFKNCCWFYLLAFAFHSTSASDDQINELSAQISHFATDFTSDCLRSAAGNVIVSPLSVATALALLSQATDGHTFEELQNGLHLTGYDKSAVANHFPKYFEQLQNNAGDSTLSIVNQIYVQQGYQLNENFRETAAKKFSSGVDSVNFSDSSKSAEIINHFVEERTHERIKDLIKPDMLDSDTRVILVNSIYFKGDWRLKFNKKDTFTGDFHTSDTDAISVEFITGKKYFNHANLHAFDARALEMEYANSKFSFIIVLPNSRNGLPELESKLKNFDLANITSQMHSAEIEVTIPKFTIQFEANLNDVLTNLGMGEIFTPKANLCGLLNASASIHVSDVVHKAFIEINEEGSEAAAATGIVFRLTSSGKNPEPEFRADHPFLYFIRETETNTIVFSGRYKAQSLKKFEFNTSPSHLITFPLLLVSCITFGLRYSKI